MLRILFAVVIIIDLGVLALLAVGVVVSINSGGGNGLFSGLGSVVALPSVVGVVFVFEMILIGVTAILYRCIKSDSKNSAYIFERHKLLR